MAGVSLVLMLLTAVPAVGAVSRAVGGRLDLSAWDFAEEGPAWLDGEWEFYWNELLEPGRFPEPGPGAATNAGSGPRYALLPGSWSGISTPSGFLPRRGFATYRLQVVLPAAVPREELGIFLPYARTAYRLYADGVLIAENGVVSRDLSAVRPRYRPTVAPLPGAGDAGNHAATVELVLQVANVHFRTGGVPKSISLGPVDELERQLNLEHMFGVALAVTMAVMALYHGTAYFWHRQEKTTLYLSLLAATLAVRTLVTGTMPFLILFPDFPWEVHLRIEYVTGFAALLFVTWFLKALYPLDMSRWVVRGVGVLSGVAIVATVLLPVAVTSRLIPSYLIFVAGISLYFSSVALRAFRQRRDPSAIVFAGGLAFFVSVMSAVLHYNHLWIKTDWLPVGTAILLFTQSFTVGRRYAMAFQREMALSARNARLLAEARRLLEERRELHELLRQQDAKLRRDVAEMLHGRAQARLHEAREYAAKASQMMQANPEEAQRILQSLQQLIDQVREEDIREASHRLHPGALAVGLVPALESLLSSLGETLEVRFEVDPSLGSLDEPGGRRLPDGVRLGLYRIAEEAFNNVRRHARARSVSVVLRREGGERPFAQDGPVAVTRNGAGPSGLRRLELLIEDDGVGMDTAHVTHGLGLRLIAARVGELRGDWAIASAPGAGTRLRVSVPVDLS